ncbi:isochorismatase family protein [Nocardioides insulae]|uniref:isochorismatase family protein n=1 Tax=Nocardioides insulae TaxID=394734 RepID=UPI00041A76CE|nr:isochorismatase family protein [Nocardioides insulae]
MALPTLIEYDAPVPPRRALPASKADWTLRPERAAVLVHDLQRYFLRPYSPECPALRGALEQTARVLAAARAAGVPVFYTAQDGDHSDRGLQGDLWGGGMSAAAEHTEIVAEVAPTDADTVLVKRRYSAFAKSDLAERLRAAGRDQLVLTGVYAHIGITATALDGFQREVHPFLVADAVADFGEEQHARAIDQVAGCCGVVTLAEDVIGAWAPEPAPDQTRSENAGEPATSEPAEMAGPWEQTVRSGLAAVLSEEVVAAAFADPSGDLFELGLDSLRAFEFLDVLAEHGVDIDFGEFTRRPTVEFLRGQGAVAAG